MHIKSKPPLCNFLFSLIVIVCSGILFSGCYIEHKLGKNFAVSSKNISILILEPDLVLKSNIKTDRKDTTNGGLDFLANIKNEDVSTVFMSELKSQLRAYGVNVFTSSRIDTFFTMAPPAYLFNIAQLELEEFSYPFKDKLTTDSLIYTQSFLLNAVNFNTWFEFTELNSDKKPEVLFSNFYIKDEINGDFKVNMLSDDVTFVYTRTDITPQSLNVLVKHAGKTNASYIYNHLLNNYIKEKMKDNVNEKYFYYYNLEKKKTLFLENYIEFRKVK